MKILCTGDIHIGRRSSRLPPSTDSQFASSAEAWSRVVELAISERVDLVTISGDLVDRANRYFEAVGALERGLLRLDSAAISTMVVAGNHDHDILPMVIDGIRSERVQLLGRNGVWQRQTFESGGHRLHVDGWSFPRESITTSPIASYPSGPEDGVPVLVLLHADLDQPRSRYAPITTAELRRFPNALFQLGHIHGARVINEPGGAQALYPGSPQALDPGETGSHGVYLLELGPGGFSSRAVPLSNVRYEEFPVRLDGVERLEDVEGRIVEEVRRRLEEIAPESGPLRHLVCRVRLTGRTRLHRELDFRIEQRAADLRLHRGDVTATVDRVTIATAPARDLSALARSAGPVGVLADLVLRLEAGDASADRLLAEATEAARSVENAAAYTEIRTMDAVPESTRRAAAREQLHRSATVLLDELLAQQEEIPA